MAANQKTEKLTIANIIAIVGVVLLMAFSYMGHSYMSGGELGWDILISVLISSFVSFLLWFLIKAKGAENNIDNWKKAEFAALAVYVVFAIPASLFGGIMQFFVVNDNKEAIKQFAEDDLKKIDSLFSEYTTYESRAIATTGAGLQNATRTDQICDENLNNFMSQNNISHNNESAKNFERLKTEALIGTGFNSYHNKYKDKRAEIKNAVSSWSIIQIPSKAKLIEELAKSAENELSRLSKKVKLPNITYDSDDGRYTIRGYQCKNFSVSEGSDSFQFKKALKETSGISFTALLVVLLIHFMILFNYLVAYRTSSIGVSKSTEEDGGRILF